MAFTISLGYHLAKSYDVNPIAGGVIAFSAVVTCMNQSAVFDYALPGVAETSLDALKGAGLDVAADGAGGVVLGLLSTMIYVKLMQKKVTMKLPASVPPAVSNASASIIPGTIAIYTFGIITQICVMATRLYPNDLIVEWIPKPLLGFYRAYSALRLYPS